MRRLRWLAIPAALVVLVGMAAPASALGQTNLVRDSGFEYPRLANVGETSRLDTVGNTISRKAWHVGCGDVSLETAAVYPALSGNQSLDLNGTQPGCIWQDLPLAINAKYKVTWHIGAPLGDGTQSWSLVGSITPGLGGVPETGQTCALPPSQCWETTFSTVFTTGDGPSRIEFDSYTPGSNGPHVDGINVHRVG